MLLSEPIRSQDYDHAQRKTVLWDRHVLSKMPMSADDPEWWQARHAHLTSLGAGRGAAWRIEIEYAGQACDWVLRHYKRGGMAAKMSDERYLGVSPDRSRSWQEWDMLARMQQLGLPVPQPVAAFFQRYGLQYRAAIIMQTIPNTRTFADCLTAQQVGRITWQAVGACIARFHAAGIFHADLNANNILLNDHGEIYLIDFDRAVQRKLKRSWQQQNLQRLRRSLNKLANKASAADIAFNFESDDWQALESAYHDIYEKLVNI